ncbi:hypothetical protein CRE_08775 [Caenorhabditis remanei]|uniref:G-protein coupled receptors family 1 profile domain-containing protein n=1 Tax=Caenorhabditis remanei TaxID=31234 RepID=E3LHG5_CAERE|nr:hypothetical protein CRE_08775 [Caenorhabditis remanei]
MYLSAAIINTVAIGFPVISGVMYSRLLYSIFYSKTIKKAPDLYLFYCKFVLDLLISIVSYLKLTTYAVAMTSLVNFLMVNHWLTFLVIWPISFLSSLRAILVFFIALDRTCATYVPILFFKYRKLIPLYLIIGIVLSYSLVDSSVAFIFCRIDLNTPTDCVNGLCVLGACYQNYWLEFQQVFYALIIALTLMLCLKLFVWNKLKKQNINQDLRRANRLALIDSAILIVFDWLPPIAHTVFPDFFDYVGAINTVSQTFGFMVEAYLVTINLRKKYRITNTTTSGKFMNRSTLGDTSDYN